MKCLLISDEEEVRGKLVFTLESTYGKLVDEINTIDEGRKMVQGAKVMGEPYDFVIYDIQKKSAQDLENFVAECKETPIVICSPKGGKGVPNAWNVLGVVDRTNLVSNLLSTLNHLFAEGRLKKGEPDSSFCKIRTKLLLSVCPLKGDIYIRLSESKYLKLFRQGDAFETADLQKYTVKKGVEYLYIRNDQTQEFVEKYRQDLEKYLQKNYNLSIEEVTDVSESIYETVQELGTRIGFNKDVQNIVKAQIRMTIKSMGASPSLGAVLKKLSAYHGKYISSHSTLTGYLACAIASQMDWGSEATYHKLNLAAFLHDITLENHDLAALTSLEDLNTRTFTEVERSAFKDHSLKAAEIARRFHEVPPDVDVIIIQHHERPDGLGFPRGMTHQHISPLSAVFIVAHEMAQFALRSGGQFNLEIFLRQIFGKYKSNQFRKVLSALEKLDPSGVLTD